MQWQLYLFILQKSVSMAFRMNHWFIAWPDL